MPIPIDRPGKIICVGLNYRDHAAETGRRAAGAPAPLREVAERADRAGRADRAARADRREGRLRGRARRRDRHAREARLARERARGGPRLRLLQRRGARATSSAATASGRAASRPTRSARSGRCRRRRRSPDPQALGIRAIVNGETLQDSTTSQMIFPVDEIIAFITQTMTLEPGDLIATGTPSRRRHRPRPAGLPAGRRRGHDRDRGDRLADEPGARGA